MPTERWYLENGICLPTEQSFKSAQELVKHVSVRSRLNSNLAS